MTCGLMMRGQVDGKSSPAVTPVTFMECMRPMKEMEAGFHVLMSSVLRILDLRDIQPGAIPARGKDASQEAFSLVDPSNGAVQGSSHSTDNRSRDFKLLRPLLPELPPILSSYRGYEDLVKAIEEEKKAGRSKLLDLFE